MKVTIINIVLFLSYICFSQSLLAQSDKKQGKGEAVPVRVSVNIDAFDDGGKPVSDLSKSEVVILEDGVAQDVIEFKKREPVKNFGLLVDNSGSMRKTLDKIVLLKERLSDELLRAGHEIFVVRFVSSDIVEVLQEWTSRRSEIVETIDNFYVEAGQSAVLDAVFLGAQKTKERKTKESGTALIVISDAEERESYYKYNDVMKLLRDSETQVNVISFADIAPNMEKKAKSLAARLTLETGGTLISMSEKFDASEFLTAVKKIVQEMQFRYVVSYVPKNQLRDGKLRRLAIQVNDGPNGEKRIGKVRESFVVPKGK